MTKPRIPFLGNALLIAAGAVLVGHNTATSVAPNPRTVVEGRTFYSTETITRRVTGQIKTTSTGIRVVHVPRIVVHTRLRRIVIPAHNLPVTQLGSAIVALPPRPVTVTILVPADPVTVTVTEQLPASTVTDTITVSVPLDPTTSDQGGTTVDSLYRQGWCERAGQRRQPARRSRHAHLRESHRRTHLQRRHVGGSQECR